MSTTTAQMTAKNKSKETKCKETNSPHSGLLDKIRKLTEEKNNLHFQSLENRTFGKEKENNLGTEYKKLADEHKHTKAERRTGEGYLFGMFGLEKNHEKAVVYLKRAAKGGDPRAKERLAYCYSTGQGVEINLLKAFNLYISAYKKGDINAIPHVAKFYSEGKISFGKFTLPCIQNIELGISLYKSLKNTKHRDHALYSLAIIYYYGKSYGIETNKELGIKYLQQIGHIDDQAANAYLADLKPNPMKNLTMVVRKQSSSQEKMDKKLSLDSSSDSSSKNTRSSGNIENKENETTTSTTIAPLGTSKFTIISTNELNALLSGRKRPLVNNFTQQKLGKVVERSLTFSSNDSTKEVSPLVDDNTILRPKNKK